MWTILKVFTEFVTYCLYFVFWFFGLETCGILAPRPEIEPTLPALSYPLNCQGSPFFHFFFFFSFIFISWRLITLQYCSGFCHTLTWISHGFTCIPHPYPPFHLPLREVLSNAFWIERKWRPELGGSKQRIGNKKLILDRFLRDFSPLACTTSGRWALEFHLMSKEKGSWFAYRKWWDRDKGHFFLTGEMPDTESRELFGCETLDQSGHLEVMVKTLEMEEITVRVPFSQYLETPSLTRPLKLKEKKKPKGAET